MPLDVRGWLGSLHALDLPGVGRLSWALVGEAEACRQVPDEAWGEPGWLIFLEHPAGALLQRALGPLGVEHCPDQALKRFEGAGCVLHPGDSAKQALVLAWLVQVLLAPVWRPPMRSRVLAAVLWACWLAPGGSPRFDIVAACPSPEGEPGSVSLGRSAVVLGTGSEPERRCCVQPRQVSMEPCWKQDEPEVPLQEHWALQAWVEQQVCLLTV